MYCKKCGRQVQPNEKFCANCGNNLQDINPVYNQYQQPQYQQPQYQQMPQQFNQKQNNKFPKSATIVLTVVGIIILLVYGLFFKACYDGCSYFTNDCYPSQC